jgi:PAS domain S-box-containing protein
MRADELRRRAEQLIAEQPERIQELSVQDIQELIQELHVHQVELEMQNEELRRAHLELEASRKKYYELYDFAPVGYFTLNEKGVILEVNLSGAALLGVERRYVVGRVFSSFLAPESQERFFYYRTQAQATGLKQHCEINIIWKNGTSFYVQLQVIAIRGDEDDTIHFHMTITDITDRKRAEDELRKSHEFLEQRIEERTEELRKNEAKYRELVQNANSIIYRRDPHGHITFFNEFAQSFFGYNEEEIIGKHVVGTIVPEMDSSGRDLAAMIEDISRAPDRYVSNINENMRRNGGRVWISWANKAILDEHGDVREILCVGNDITSLRQTKDALRKSEEQYRALVENIGIGISLISPDMEILALNKQMREWFPAVDVAERPLCYRSFNDPPRDEICSFCPTKAALRDGEVHEVLTETPAGDTIRNYRILASPIKDTNGNVTAAIEMVEDITENLELREQLTLSEKLYETVFETTGAGTVIIEDDMTLSLVNEEFARISGYRKEDIRGRSWTEFVAEKDLEMMKAYHHLRRVDSHKVPSIYRCTLVDRYGTEKDIIISVSMIPGTKRTVASFLDVSEQVKLQRQLIEQEHLYRLLADNVSDVIWTMDMTFRLTYLSPSAMKLFGYSIDEIHDISIIKILTPDSRGIVMNLWKQFTETVRRSDDQARLREPRTVELDLFRKDDSIISVETQMTYLPPSDKHPEAILGVTRDITERKRAEEDRWETEHRYHILFDHSPMGVFHYDTDLQVIDCNETAASRLRTTREDIIGIDLKSLEDRSLIPALTASLEGTEGVFEGYYRTTVSRTDLWVSLRTAPLYSSDGTIDGGVSIMEDITDRVRAQKALEKSKEALEIKTRSLEESNTALRVLFDQVEKNRHELQWNVLYNVKELIIPYVEKLRACRTDNERDTCLQVLETNMNNIISPFLRHMTLTHYKLTPKELHVANLVKEGKTNKAIADLLHLSIRSVEFHRDNIRKKLGLKNKKANLQSFLSSLK